MACFIFIVLSCIAFVQSQFTSSDLNVSISLIRHLNAKNSIVIAEPKDFVKMQNIIKYLTFDHEIFTACRTFDQLTEFINVDEYVLFKYGYVPALHPHKITIVAKCKINDIRDVLIRVQYTNRIRPFDWIIILESEDVLSGRLSKIKYTHYDANFLIVYQMEETYKILELYNIKPFYDPLIKFYGTWSNGTGLTATNQSTYTRRMNLQKAPLALYTYYIELEILELKLYPLPLQNLFEFWKDMSMIMNFSTINISLSNRHQQSENTIHELTDAYLNLAAWNWITKDMILYNIVPISTHKAFFYIKYETELPAGLQELLRPFSTGIWICISIWLFTSTLFLLIADHLAKKYFSAEGNTNLSLINSIFTPFEILINQGETNLRRVSNRILFISILVKVVVLMPLYTGAIAAFLTIANPYLPFNDVSGFVKDGRYRIVAVDNTFHGKYLEAYYKFTNDPTYKELYEKYYANATKAEDLFDEVNVTCCEKNFAFLSSDKEPLTKLNGARILEYYNFPDCRMLQIPEVIFTTTSGLLTNHDSTLTSVFKYNWLRFEEHGISNKIKISSKPLKYHVNHVENEFHRINMNNVTPAFTIIGIGLLISAILFSCEWIYFYWKEIWSKKLMLKPKRSIFSTTGPEKLLTSIPRHRRLVRDGISAPIGPTFRRSSVF